MTVVPQLRHFFRNSGNGRAVRKHERLIAAKRSHIAPGFRQSNCLMRIFEHEATVFIGNDIKFGVGNVGINDVSHIVIFLMFLIAGCKYYRIYIK